MKTIFLGLYRVRGVLYYAAAAILIGNAIRTYFVPNIGIRGAWGGLLILALILAVLSILLTFLGPRFLPAAPEVLVQPPVRGRWLALNSPATKVPSHGVRAYGQAFAIDLVYEPLSSPRPEFGGRFMRESAAYPAFGEPVHAMIGGTVVRASDWRRDHRARSNGLAVIYLMIEATVREIGGPGWVIGNHVVIRRDDGIYATIAHVRRGSLRVAPGDRVRAGDVLGDCGNSGNSSEPHVHAQLMDRASFWTGQGIPMVFGEITLEDRPGITTGLPGNGERMIG